MARSPLFRRFMGLLQKSRWQSLPEENHPGSTSKPTQIMNPPRSLSRRRFLRYSALAGGAAIATTALSKTTFLHPAAAQSDRIAIIGGGIAGLNAAYQLKKFGFTAMVYEAKPYPGRRIQSRRVVNDALVNDLGGSFINTDHADILSLVEDFGLELFNRIETAEQSSFPETAYYFEGRAIPEAEWVELLRPLADQLFTDAISLDEDFDTYAPQFDRLSVAEYLDQHQDKIPAPYVRTLAENALRTEYGAEAQESSALQLIYTVTLLDGDAVAPIGSDETYYVKGGSGQLIESLVRALPGQVQMNMPLVQIQSQGEGYRLTFGDRSTVEADYVILALPFMALRHVDIQVNLPDTLRRFIHEVNLGRNDKLFAGFNQRVWHQDQGFIGEAWTDLGYSQVWEETQRQPDQPNGVLTFFLGGDETRRTGHPLSQQGQQFVERLESMIPGVKAASTGQYHRTHWANDPYIGGGYTTFKPGQYLEFGEFLYIESDDPEERVDVHFGNLVFAGEHLSDEFYGYMNGGAQTGRLAAEVVTTLIHERHRAHSAMPTG